MAFEKGTNEYEFFKTLRIFEEETARLIFKKKQKQAVREYFQHVNPQRVYHEQESVIDSAELIHRAWDVEDILKGLETLIGQIDTQFETYDEQFMKLGALRAKLNERKEIYDALSSFLKDSGKEQFTEERMTEKFKNVHMWKKEFSDEFLILLHNFCQTLSVESKNIILEKLSLLKDEFDNVPTSESIVLYGSDDTSTISDKGIKNALQNLTTRRDDLRILEVQATTLYNNLTKIQNEIN